MEDYKAIFGAVESTLISVGSHNLPAEKIRENLDAFKHIEGKSFSDAEYYWKLVCVIFYSGFKAATVNAKLDLIRRYFPDYETVAGYRDGKINEILNDSEMIKHRGKVQACVDNARAFKGITNKHGSFQKYIESFAPKDSFENLMRLREDLKRQFAYLGKVTAYHFLTDIGMPVLKPDRVIRRIFYRLGFIESEDATEEQLLKTVFQGDKLARATGHPIRYVDIVFVAYGQMESEDFGLDKGICLKENPRCSICGVRNYCNYFAQNVQGKHGERA